MIVYLAEWKQNKDSLFRSIVSASQQPGRRLSFIRLSFRGFAQSRPRSMAALAVAKRQPKGKAGRVLKYWLIWAQYNWSRRYFSKHPEAIALCWNGMTGSRRVFMEGARDAGAKLLFAELAPFPNRVTLDPRGVNAANSLPRTPDYYAQWAASNMDDPSRWRSLGASLSARISRRSDVTQVAGRNLNGLGPYLFVPLQVPDDSQITLFGGWTKSVQGMINALAAASKALPEGWHIRVKEHPSAKISLSKSLEKAVETSGGRVVVDNSTDTFELVATSRGVVTVNSSVGLQAFFYDKPVVVLGEAFFAIPSISVSANSPEELFQLFARPDKLSFDQTARDAFMNYLDQVYYPVFEQNEKGDWTVVSKDVQAKLRDAME